MDRRTILRSAILKSIDENVEGLSTADVLAVLGEVVTLEANTHKECMEAPEDAISLADQAMEGRPPERLWPNGVPCPTCKSGERITEQPRSSFYYRCNACQLDFTVVTGAISLGACKVPWAGCDCEEVPLLRESEASRLKKMWRDAAFVAPERRSSLESWLMESNAPPTPEQYHAWLEEQACRPKKEA